jgi:Protein of unknown function (DUF3455)
MKANTMNVPKFSTKFSIGATTLTTLLALTTYQSLAEAPPIPDIIQVPTGQTKLLSVAATGDQIYTCQAKSDRPNEYAWTLKAPEAKLLNSQGEQVGTHYGGPSWEMADGSIVVGELSQKVDAPEADAIPWLLVRIKSHEGEGLLSQANWIQRVNTAGGKAPATGCDRANQNQEVRVGYSADYYFYGDAARSSY